MKEKPTVRKKKRSMKKASFRFTVVPCFLIENDVPSRTKSESCATPGGASQKVLRPWHTVHIALEEREFNERIDRFREEHKLRFRYVLIELHVLEDLNLTLPLYPSHV